MNDTDIKQRMQELVNEARAEADPHVLESSDDQWQAIAWALAAKMAILESAVKRRVERMKELTEEQV